MWLVHVEHDWLIPLTLTDACHMAATRTLLNIFNLVTIMQMAQCKGHLQPIGASHNATDIAMDVTKDHTKHHLVQQQTCGIGSALTTCSLDSINQIQAVFQRHR